MSLVTSKEILQDARKNGYAVGAFNVENMEMVMAVLAAAEEMQSPVIMQTTPGTVRYAGLDYYLANVAAAAARTKVPVVMHLDHGESFEMAMAAYRTGYTSIMIDGSKLSLEENIALTKSVTAACHPGGVPVEGELGKVGGKEDDLDNGDDNPYTDPQEAARFAEETGVDVPLVLHGTSGVPDEQVIQCVKQGICKVNYATDLRIAFTQGVKEYMGEHPEAFDPKKYAARGMEKVKAYVMQKMQMLGSQGKA